MSLDRFAALQLEILFSIIRVVVNDRLLYSRGEVVEIETDVVSSPVVSVFEPLHRVELHGEDVVRRISVAGSVQEAEILCGLGSGAVRCRREREREAETAVSGTRWDYDEDERCAEGT